MNDEFDKLLLEIKKRNKAVVTIANNALYFDDNSDYQTALWEILRVLNPKDFYGGKIPVLKYIEEGE